MARMSAERTVHGGESATNTANAGVENSFHQIGEEVAFPKGGVFATAEVAAGVVDEPGQIP